MDTLIESANQDATMTLAPAAGAGIGKKVADALLAQDGFVDLMVNAMTNGLKATRSFYVKDEGMQTEPDFKVQLQAAALIMAHMEGEPVKRIIHQHLGAGGKLDVGAALTDSPELAQAVERELQKARWKHSGHQAHKKPKKVEPAGEEMPVG
jgi:hypothetical protein